MTTISNGWRPVRKSVVFAQILQFITKYFDSVLLVIFPRSMIKNINVNLFIVDIW